jgi:hypothetical protein
MKINEFIFYPVHILCLVIHRYQELFIVPCFLETIVYKIHCFHWIHIREVFSHNPHALQRFLI